MLMVFDIGNSNIVLGIYEGEELIYHWRIYTDKQKTFDEYGILIYSLLSYNKIKTKKIKSTIISSVVPPLTKPFIKMCKHYFNSDPLIVGPKIKTDIHVLGENPQELGADRIVNAVASYEKFNPPIIIVDLGTATTFCVINKNKEYLGGVIAPGVSISSEALFQYTAKLPRISLIKPRNVITRNTTSSIQAGIIYGFAGLIDGIVLRMKAELTSDAYVVATGGFANLIAPESNTINIVDNFLTLEGLKIIYAKNK